MSTIIRYPSEFTATPNTDYIHFTSVRRNYKSANLGPLSTTTTSAIHDDEPQNGIAGIILYMPQRIAESNTQNYRNSTLGPEVSAALTGGPVGSGRNTIDFADIAIRLVENRSLDFVAQALSKLGTSALDANSILSATAGVIYNPMMEVLYDGPQFRTFNYQFMLFAKSEADAANIYKIVRFFQKCSVPSLNGDVDKRIVGPLNTATQVELLSGLATNTFDAAKNLIGGALNPDGSNKNAGAGGGLGGLFNTAITGAGGFTAAVGAQSGLIFSGTDRFIKQPPQLRIEYKRGSDLHPYIKSPEISVINNIQIDYTPSGNYTVLNDFVSQAKATTVATVITLTLTETKVIYSDYYDD